jgi:hypothetical protein
MLQKVFFHLCICSLLFVIMSCRINLEHTTPRVLCDTALKLSDSEIARSNCFDRRGNYSISFYDINQYVESLGLRALKNGYDSIAIRIWHVYRYKDAEVIELRKHCSGWAFDAFTVNKSIKPNGDTTFKIVDSKSNMQPNSGWLFVAEKLSNFEISKLPDWSEIENYDPSSDGDLIDVEISTISTYRIYTYLQPKGHLRIKEVSNFMAFFDLLYNEFDLK